MDDPSPITIPGISRAPRREGSAAGVLGAIASLVVIAVGAVYLWDVYDRRSTEQAEATAARAATELQNAAEKIIAQAIVEGRVVVGMSEFEVRKSVGHPDNIMRAGTLGEEAAKLGVYQVWGVNTNRGTRYVIMFNVDGTVVHVRENKKG